MKPAFAITIDGQAVPPEFVERVLAITVNDNAGQEADTCEVALDDRALALDLPPEKASLEVALGYIGQQLVSQGTYIIDEVEIGNGPRSMVIKATATPVGAAGVSTDEGASGAISSLLNYVYQGEGGYNSYNRGGAGDSPGDYPGGLTRLTIGQVMDLQASGKVKAVGAAQFIPETLPGAMSAAGLTRGDLFSPTNQDKMAAALMLGSKRPNLAKFLKGQSNDITAAQQDLCQEFASVVCPSGRGFYDNDGAGNLASGSVAEAQAALKAGRAQLAANLGASEAEVEKLDKPAAATGGSAAPRALIKDKRTQSYHDTTLGEIAGEIAKRHGLKLNIEGDAGSIEIKHEDQTNESDQNFLTRLADKYKLVIKPAEGALHIHPRGEQALGGNTELEQRQVRTWRARMKDRAKYGKVRARYIDREENKEKVVEVEGEAADEEAVDEIPELHRTEEEAKSAAASRLQGLTSGEVEITIGMPGLPTLVAQGTITLTDFHPSIDGEPWLIKNVSHRYESNGGFSTSVTCGTPGDFGKEGKLRTPVTPGKADKNVVEFAPGVKPVTGWTPTSDYGSRSGRHAGVDYAMPEGTRLSAKQGGKVLLVSQEAGYGKFVDVQLNDGSVARLAHLSQTWVAPGTTFGPNQVFALSGNTGRSTGPHLHFENRTGGAVSNPGTLIRQFSADP